MSVFVLTEGGRDKGFGHVARCLAISDALKNLSQGNCDVKFIINGDNSVQSIFGNREVGLEIYPWHAEIDRLEQEISSVDRVLIDSYLADTETYSRISEKVNKRMLIIDDYCRIQYPEGIVVNPTLLSKELGYAKNKDTKYLLGSEYAILREEFFDVPSRKVNADIKDILITMGATEHLDCIGGIVESLSEKGDFKFHVIAGRPDFHSKVEGVLIEKGYGAKVDIYSGLSAGEMRDLMLKCDVAISGGGQTLNELACCGTPVI